MEQTFILFPFDKSVLSLAIFASVSIDGESHIIPVALNLVIPEIQRASPVYIGEEIIAFYLGREFGYNTEHFVATIVDYRISRPFTTKFLVILIPVIILFYLYLMVKLKDTSSAAGIAFGIFIGLWSIKSVLIPD